MEKRVVVLGFANFRCNRKLSKLSNGFLPAALRSARKFVKNTKPIGLVIKFF